MQQKSFEIKRPRTQTGSVIFASPHSGNAMPEGFVRSTLLTELQIRSSEDAFVDRLYEAAPQLGSPILLARAPRAFVDLNRGADELDPALIEGIERKTTNPRIVSGLGVIPRVVANGRHIYRGKLSLDAAYDRISKYWRPYHDALQMLFDETKKDFGEAILVDCHSMPVEALESVSQSGKRPDIVLGDRFGASCRESVTERVAAAFERQGFRVARNMPFAGAYIAQHYGRPSINQHVIQIEINRALYMDERTILPSDQFWSVQQAVTAAMIEIIDIGRQTDRLAAE